MASRKDYEAVVDALHSAAITATDVKAALSIVFLAMTDHFADDNPRFSRGLFIDECANAIRNADTGGEV
jgi:hypothetical protein